MDIYIWICDIFLSIFQVLYKKSGENKYDRKIYMSISQIIYHSTIKNQDSTRISLRAIRVDWLQLLELKETQTQTAD